MNFRFLEAFSSTEEEEEGEGEEVVASAQSTVVFASFIQCSNTCFICYSIVVSQNHKMDRMGLNHDLSFHKEVAAASMSKCSCLLLQNHYEL
jgi:hypothetical protein